MYTLANPNPSPNPNPNDLAMVALADVHLGEQQVREQVVGVEGDHAAERARRVVHCAVEAPRVRGEG